MRFVLFLALVLSMPAYAADEPAARIAPAPAAAGENSVDAFATPTKESLVAFWEKQARADENIQKLEKTAEADVYDFETTYFPYKGRLKLLNASVSRYQEQYYENLYRGIVEVELLDADETFFKKYARSYGSWVQDYDYYFNAKKGLWFASADWEKYSRDFDKYAENKSGCTPASTGFKSFWQRNQSNITFWSIFAVVIGALLFVAKKQNKRVWDNHEKALSEQQRGLKMVEESHKIAQESLKHQQEHTALLKEILAALRK